MFTKQKVAMLVAEFLGTAILTLTVLAISTSNIGIGYFVSFGAGLALLLMVFAIGGVSGAVINPALTLGLWSVRKLQTTQALLYIVVQLLGGLLAFVLFAYMTDLGDQLSSRTFDFDTKVMVAEVVGTAVFAFGVAAALYNKLEGGVKAALIGGSLTLGIMIASATATAGYLNPAVALGAQAWEWGNFVLGPILGAVIGFNLYNLLFIANQKTAAVKVSAPAKVKSATKTSKKKK